LEQTLKPAIEQKSLFKKGKIILVDEVDGLSASDAGGLPLLIEMINATTIPVIITANDIWDRKFNELRKKAELAQLKEVSYIIIKEILIEILRKERCFIPNDVLTAIAVKARGDVRAAINDVQLIAAASLHGETAPEASQNIAERDKEKDIFNVLKYIFKSKPQEDMLTVFDHVDMSLDEIMLWIEENIPREYNHNAESMAKAYELLSIADVFKGRIHRRQHWRFLIYKNALLGYGIASAKKYSHTSFVAYQKPSRILKIWMNNQQIAKKIAIAEKFSRLTHINKKRALNNFPIILYFLDSNEIYKKMNLSEEEQLYVENLRRKELAPLLQASNVKSANS
jgi:replication factor C large subunit